MKPDSATANLLRPLKTVGLVDKDGKPTDRAVRWRDDTRYPDVCKEIREEVYPREVRDAFPELSVDRTALVRWFANHARVGEDAARKMAGFYLLLLEADPTRQDGTVTIAERPRKGTAPSPDGRRKPREATATDRPSKDDSRSTSGVEMREQPRQADGMIEPSLHIDIQIHISPEASADQIDSIFASMAKHLYKRSAAE